MRIVIKKNLEDTVLVDYELEDVTGIFMTSKEYDKQNRYFPIVYSDEVRIILEKLPEEISMDSDYDIWIGNINWKETKKVLWTNKEFVESVKV